MRPKHGWLFILTGLGLVGCDHEPLSPPQGDIRLASLTFVHEEIVIGTPIVLAAETHDGQPVRPQSVLIESSAGRGFLASLDPFEGCGPLAGELPHVSGLRSPWDACPDDALATLIAAARGEVVIGFKESNDERGVDPTGRVLTSNATVTLMTDWLREQGVSVTFVAQLIPAVGGTMDASLSLVERVRHHSNVDYLEPSFPGQFAAGTLADPMGVVAGAEGLAVVMPDAYGSLRLRAGETVVATYRQPDGSVLTATARVRTP